MVSAEPELHTEDDGAEAGDKLEADYMAVGDEILDADTDYWAYSSMDKIF